MTDKFKTYYVNPTIGTDTNDGLSEESAFASLSAVNQLTLNPGDRVLLANGSVFQSQFLPFCSNQKKKFFR